MEPAEAADAGEERRENFSYNEDLWRVSSSSAADPSSLQPLSKTSKCCVNALHLMERHHIYPNAYFYE